MTQQDVFAPALISIISDTTINTVTPEVDSVIKFFHNELTNFFWHKLIQINQGPILATAGCLPIWETLTYLSSNICQLDGESRAYFILALTSLYPKYKDRRCFSQHIGGYGSGNSVVSLINSSFSILEGSSILANQFHSRPIKELINLSTSPSFLTAKLVDSTKNIFLSNMKALVQTLPEIKIKWSLLDGVTIIVGDDVLPLLTFQFMVWRVLILCQINNINEGRELETFLTNSTWSSNIVTYSGEERKFGYFFNHFLENVRILTSLGCPGQEVPIDNSPLIDFRVVKQFTITTQRSQRYLNKLSKKLPLKGVTFVSQKIKTVSQVSEDIDSVINSIEFEENSSACRNCDELTTLCRDLVFRYSKSAFRDTRYNSLSRKTRNLLFKRKYKNIKYFPTFLPEMNTPFSCEEETKKVCLLENILVSDCGNS